MPQSPKRGQAMGERSAKLGNGATRGRGAAADPIETGPPAPGSWPMALISALAPMLLVTLGLQVPGSPGFSQWDGFEAFLPAILWTHRRLLAGELPLWNPMQNLGEPIHAMGVGGLLYFPYTLATLWVDSWHMDPRTVMDVIVAMHVAFAGLGLYRLARSFGVRPLLAMVAAVSTPMSGFILYVGAIWIHTLPALAWGAWGAWAVKSIVDRHRTAWAVPVAVLALALPFSAGHIQPAVYNLVVTAGFAWLYALARGRAGALPSLVAVGVAGVLLALPAILPTAALVPDTVRRTGVSAMEFGGRNLRLSGLIGFLLPVYRGHDGFIDEVYLDTLYVGGWLVPALLGGLALVMLSRRAVAGMGPGPDGLTPGRGFAIAGATALGVMILSMGDQTPVYGWTRIIPMWSNFRWPFKLFLHALPYLALTGAVGLELLVRDAGTLRRWVGIGTALAALALWIALPGLRTPAAVATGVLGLVAMLSLAWMELPAARVVLAVATILGAGGTLVLTQRPDRYKTYLDERVGEFGPAAFGLSPDFRVVPLSSCEPQGERMQELGLFQSATLDGYFALTGHRFALSSMRLENFVPTGDDGVIARQIVPSIVQSHLLKGFNVRYAIAARNDSGLVAFMDQVPGWKRHRETAHAIVYENPEALARMYFASQVEPFEMQRMFIGLVRNAAPVTCAFVEGERAQLFARPGRVVSSSWRHDRITAELDSPQAGFLVVSMSYSADWVARLDGRVVPLMLTNGTVSGLAIAPGARHLELRYQPRSFRIGVWAALAGMLLALVTAVALSRGSQRRVGAIPW